jgi:hypothetical protein
MMLESTNRDIVHHLLIYECDPTAVFDDSNLPEGLCDYMTEINSCVSNIATAWAVGGDDVSFSRLLFIRKGSCLNRSWNFQRLLDIQ